MPCRVRNVDSEIDPGRYEEDEWNSDEDGTDDRRGNSRRSSDNCSPGKTRDSRDFDSVAFDPDLDPPAQCCFNCWEAGHAYMECKQPQRGYHCYRCGRKGVSVTSCPRCSNAALGPRRCTRSRGSKNAEREERRNQSRVSQESLDVVNPIQDFLVLMRSIAHLNVETQNSVVQQVVMERKALLRQRNPGIVDAKWTDNRYSSECEEKRALSIEFN